MRFLVTIYDVAAKAGVGMKTVSRVLNNEAHVRPAMKERVMKAIDELGYRPNLAARQLAASRSFLITFILSDVFSSYQTSMLVAASTECRLRNYHLGEAGRAGDGKSAPRRHHAGPAAQQRRRDCQGD